MDWLFILETMHSDRTILQRQTALMSTKTETFALVPILSESSCRLNINQSKTKTNCPDKSVSLIYNTIKNDGSPFVFSIKNVSFLSNMSSEVLPSPN